MQTAIYSSEQHKQIIEIYVELCKQFAQEVATKTRYKNYLDVLQLIVDYSNGYGEGVRENNFYDWIMILPINLSVMTSGFLAGIETKKNAAVVRAYKVVLDQMLQETVAKLDRLEPSND
tara:strand:- start:1183 stop:1539 length:357 start_codon:yes stop_codon:yes gene_type:complete